MLPKLIDGAPLRGAPVRLPMEVIHKLCLIHLYLYPKKKVYLSKMLNIFFEIEKCAFPLRSTVEVIHKLSQLLIHSTQSRAEIIS